MDHYVHRTARLGASVLISESWYKGFCPFCLVGGTLPERYPRGICHASRHLRCSAPRECFDQAVCIVPIAMRA